MDFGLEFPQIYYTSFQKLYQTIDSMIYLTSKQLETKPIIDVYKSDVTPHLRFRKCTGLITTEYRSNFLGMLVGAAR